MRSYLFFVLLTSSLMPGCKKDASGTGGTSAIESAVTIQVPAQVQGKVNKARLTGNTASDASTVGRFDRKFEKSIETVSGGGATNLSFQKDTSNENIRVGDNLYTVTLELLRDEVLVYSGVGNVDPFVIKAGQNPIQFNLDCKDPTTCPTGSALKIIQVQGVGSDPALAPQILATVVINSAGNTEPERRALLQGCKTQVGVKSSSQWGTEFSDGLRKANLILAADPLSVCAGSAVLMGGYCLNDYIKLCQDLRILQ